MYLGKLATLWKRYRKVPAPDVSSRVEDMARAAFPGDERGNPGRAQVEHREALARAVRTLCECVRATKTDPQPIGPEAANVLEEHFLSPRDRDGRPVA